MPYVVFLSFRFSKIDDSEGLKSAVPREVSHGIFEKHDAIDVGTLP